MFTLKLVDYDPTSIVGCRRKRKRKQNNDRRQMFFPFMLQVEARPRRLELWEIEPESCKALWAAVLKSGIESYMWDIDGRSEDDKHWMIYDHEEEKKERVGSFRYCCNILGLDSDILRDKIIRGR